MTVIGYAIARVNQQRAGKGEPAAPTAPLPEASPETPVAPVARTGEAGSAPAATRKSAGDCLDARDMYLPDKRAPKVVPPLYEPPAETEAREKREQLSPWVVPRSPEEEARLREIAQADRSVEALNFERARQREDQLFAEADEAAEARRRMIARCREEVRRIKAQDPNTQERAYLVTMGTEDWRAEALLLEYGPQ